MPLVGWGGVAGWMKCKIRLGLGLSGARPKAEFGHLELEHGLNLSFEEFPGWWWGGRLGKARAWAELGNKELLRHFCCIIFMENNDSLLVPNRL